MREAAMARTISTATVCAATAGAVGPGASAAGPTLDFAGSNARFAGDCGGADARLAGDRNRATIRGACRALRVAGDGNRVFVEMAPHGRIEVRGRDNEVSWTAAGEVEATAVGPGNIVARAR